MLVADVEVISFGRVSQSADPRGLNHAIACIDAVIWVCVAGAFVLRILMDY